MRRGSGWLWCTFALWFIACWPALAGFYVNTISPGNVPWPGGVVPYVIDPALSGSQQQTYLNGLREYELVANVHFIARTSEPQYILFKYDPAGPNRVSGSNPQLVEINLLTRGQICHEMGHSFGLLHEHIRPDRNNFVNVLTANVTAGNQFWFDIDPNGTAHSSYDFESVMHFSRDLFSVQPGVLDTLQARPGFERFQPRMGGFALSKGDRAVMKYLYGPGPALSQVVTNTSESGVGSLRAAMHYVSDNPGAAITFNIPTNDPGYANGVFTIRPTGHLAPFVIDGAIIDGTTQPGYTGSPLIVLDGSQILPEAGSVPGMFVYAANCTVKGLSFRRFPWVGLALLFPDAHGNTLRACWFGLDSAGTASAPNGTQGIFISNGASMNTIGGATAADRNVISGNAQYGIWISGATTAGNIVLGNYIGTSASGLAAVSNGYGGVIVTDSSHDNSIGGTSPGARNVISGNADAGVWLTGAGVDANLVRGNYIGLAASGATAIPNTFAGLNILNGARNNLVTGNVISGNAVEGLRIANSGTTGNMVQGNLVGAAPGGSSAIGNGFVGIAIYAGATGNTIGGATATARNIISGNGTYGLVFGDSGTSGNFAYGNFIGTDASGTASVPNGFAGLGLFSATHDNVIGDAGGRRNVLSGNGTYGILIADMNTNSNLVRGNTVGQNAAGSGPVPNGGRGIALQGGARDNRIGGTGAGESNLIAGNGSDGIVLFEAPTVRNSISANSIHDNGGMGIVLVPDALNGGTKPNNGQAFPTLSSAVLSTGGNTSGTDVSGQLVSANNTTYRVEFFASPTADPSGFGEGQFFIGSTNVTTNGLGSVNFTSSLAAAVPAGYVIVATATDPLGNTSELSATRSVITTDTMPTGGDGLPDAWMQAQFGHIDPRANDLSRANDDADGDGLTNLQEFRAGTDPRLGSSRLRVTSVTRSANDAGFTFTSVPGKTYRIESKNDLSLGNWSLFEDQILASGASTAITDFSAGVLPRRFYRVAIEP